MTYGGVMGKETSEILSVKSSLGEDNDLYVGKKLNRKEPWIPNGTEIRYFTRCITNEDDRIELERIMTKSLKTGGVVQNPGDMFVINEAGSFDKDGCYHVIVKYMVLP